MAEIQLVDSATSLDPEVRRALRRHVLTLADSKRLMGIRYSDWVLGAPSIETDIATSSMAQDEWGHARLLYAMLKDFDEDPAAVEHDRPADQYASVDPLDQPLPDWAALVSAMLVVDGALTAALEGFAGGAYEPARTRVPKMVSEEEFHRDLALAWFRRIAGGTDEGRERLTAAVRAQLPAVLAWLAPHDEAFDRLVVAGLTESPETLLHRYRERLGGLLDLLGLTVVDIDPATEGWDAERGRGPGKPSADAVERARGDRNRALLVE